MFPLLSVWLVFGYIHFIQFLGMRGFIPVEAGNYRYFIFYFPSLKLFAFFIPVIAFEFIIAKRFSNKYTNKPFLKLTGPWLSFIVNTLFWFLIFLIWVVFVCFAANTTSLIWKWFGPMFFLMVIVILRSMFWSSIVAGVIWLAIHYAFTIRMGRFRILTSFVFPVFIVVLIFLHQWNYGGLWGSNKNIVKQAGVEKMYDISELHNAVSTGGKIQNKVLGNPEKSVPVDSIHIKNQPRGICVDDTENAFIATYGCTFCVSPAMSVMMIRKDMDSGTLQYLLGDVQRNIRQMICQNSGPTLILAPWHDPYIYELLKQDLSVVRKIHNQAEPEIPYWEPNDLLRDISGNTLYVSNDQFPAIASFDLKSGNLKGILNLSKSGLVLDGGKPWYLVQSKKTRRIYFIGCPGESDLFEIDPDTLKVTRQLKLELDTSCGAGLILDDDKGLLYYQSGFFNSLYQINVEQFKVEREYPGEFFARRIRIDKERNVLYVLGYISGTVFSIDLDSGKRLWKVNVGGRPHGMHFKNDALWIHSMAGVFRINLPEVWRDKGYTEKRFIMAK